MLANARIAAGNSGNIRMQLRDEYDARLGRIDSAIADAELRVHRMRRFPSLDEKRLRSGDLMAYHRYYSHTRTVNVQVERLFKTVEWTAHRSGPELISRAKAQQREAATDNFEADGNTRDSVPLVDDAPTKLDKRIHALLESFGVLQEVHSTGYTSTYMNRYDLSCCWHGPL
jgi:hypothetical protein